jgi:tryptophan-rich sensory protein
VIGMSQPMPRWRPTVRLAVSLAAPLLVGATAGWATAQGVSDWYPALVKPSFNPPAWVFGPVWTLLYVLMGVACYLVWQRVPDSPPARRALTVYWVQLLLNFLWSFLFFGARSPGWAFAEICLLWAALLWTVVLFFRESRWAGWLMVPYLGWVSFAAVLNASIWVLNSG